MNKETHSGVGCNDDDNDDNVESKEMTDDTDVASEK